jgi:hypothetical protein
MNRALISFLVGALFDLCAILAIVVFRVMVPAFPMLKAGSAQAVVLAAIPLIGLLSGLIAAALKRLRLFNVEVTKAVSLGVSWLAGWLRARRCNSVCSRLHRDRRVPASHGVTW